MGISRGDNSCHGETLFVTNTENFDSDTCAWAKVSGGALTEHMRPWGRLPVLQNKDDLGS